MAGAASLTHDDILADAAAAAAGTTYDTETAETLSQPWENEYAAPPAASLTLGHFMHQ